MYSSTSARNFIRLPAGIEARAARNAPRRAYRDLIPGYFVVRLCR
jgi:hypothetical protein